MSGQGHLRVRRAARRPAGRAGRGAQRRRPRLLPAAGLPRVRGCTSTSSGCARWTRPPTPRRSAGRCRRPPTSAPPSRVPVRPAGRRSGSRFRWLTAPRSTVDPARAGAHRSDRGPGRRGRPAAAPARAARRGLTPAPLQGPAASVRAVGAGSFNCRRRGVLPSHGDRRRGRERHRPVPRCGLLRAARFPVPVPRGGHQARRERGRRPPDDRRGRVPDRTARGGAPAGQHRRLRDPVRVARTRSTRAPRGSPMPGTRSSQRRTTLPGVSATRRSRTRTATAPTCSPSCPPDPPRSEQGVDPPRELEVELGDAAGRVGDQGQVQRAPAQVDVGVVVHLLGDVGDRARWRRRRPGSWAARRCGGCPSPSPDQCGSPCRAVGDLVGGEARRTGHGPILPLIRSGVDAALRLVAARPAAGARVLARRDRAVHGAQPIDG